MKPELLTVETPRVLQTHVRFWDVETLRYLFLENKGRLERKRFIICSCLWILVFSLSALITITLMMMPEARNNIFFVKLGLVFYYSFCFAVFRNLLKKRIADINLWWPRYLLLLPPVAIIYTLLAFIFPGEKFTNQFGVNPNDYEALDTILARLEKKGSPNWQSHYGQTELIKSCKLGYEKAAILLIEQGANINLSDKNGYTPLHYASAHGHLNIVNLLIKHQVKLNLRDYICRETPLFKAVDNNHINIVKTLLENGADPLLFNFYTELPVSRAISYGFKEIDELLKKYSQGIIAGGSLLHLFVRFNNVLKVRELLSGGEIESLNEKDKHDFHPLDLAYYLEHSEMFSMLQEVGAEFSLPFMGGKCTTPLHYACEKADFETAARLVNDGMSLRWCNNFGRSVLHQACYFGTKEIVVLLIEAGSEINCTDNYGYTPLHLAILGEKPDIVELLLHYNADVYARTANNISTLDFANNVEHELIKKMLKIKGVRE